MATKTVVCPECGDPVTYGRLSCPACGALLASVAGGAVRVAPQAEVVLDVAPPTIAADVEEVPLPPSARRAGAAATRAASGGASAVRAAAASARGAAAAVRSAAAGSEPAAEVATATKAASNGHGGPAGARTSTRRRIAAPAAPEPTVPPATVEWPASAASMEIGASNGGAIGGMTAHTGAGSMVPRSDPANPGPMERAASLSASLASPLGAAVEAGQTLSWPSQPAGAYLPPSAVFVSKSPAAQAARAIRARQIAPSSPPVGWRDGVAWPGDPPQPGPTPTSPDATSAGSAPLLADLPFDIPTTVAGWLIAAGSGVAAVSFLLPWSSNVIGAKGIGTYLDSWGLASPPSFIVFAVTVAVLALAVIPNRVPVWLRTGVAGLLLGGVLVGLTWPYVIGGWADGPQVGVLGEVAGAIMLIAGGTLAQRPARHEGEPAGV